ncbi:hypothetical protein [Teredinibacter purpureus]|uniref:hypothetical protein n=1 Tax=Teredinibacter purpureus TaxID=2731756 RepID=UPI0005F829F8|nr:hypothetical protein [Teredinibacter purpureus]
MKALAKRYAKLEVEALKNSTVKGAEEQIRKAECAKADDFAPLTLTQSKSELKLAKKVLESDADAREKAADHANKAYKLANRAI